MKKIYGLLALAATLGFASCSQDGPDGPNIVTPDMVNSYVNVRIAAPGVSGTRAEYKDGGYEYGEDSENTVTNYLLLFYDAAGNLVGQSETGLNETTKNPTGQNVAVIKKGTAEVTLAEGANLPTQLVALVNVPDGIADVVTKTNLAGLNNILVGANGSAALNAIWTANNFLMNNSVYYSDATGSAQVMAVDITEDMLYSSQQAAEQALQAGTNVVDIYVERLAVKGSLDLASNLETQLDNNVIDPDGNVYTLTFNVSKYDVTATAPTSFYFKRNRDYSEFSNVEFATWMNAYTDHRSYWAQSYVASLSNATYPVVGSDTGNTLVYKSTTQVETNGKDPKATTGNYVYFPENTLRASKLVGIEENPWVAATAFVLNGKYNVAAVSTGDATKYSGNFYLKATINMVSGETEYNIFNEEEALNSLNYAQVKIATDEDGNFDPTDVVELTHIGYFFDAAGTQHDNNPANRMTVQLTEDYDVTQLYVLNDEGEWELNEDGTVTADEINTALAKVGRTFMMYNGGQAYFYIPIKHYTGNMEDASANFPTIANLNTGNIGVVRNHVYKMTVNKITGLGIGVGPDPNIPELPDPDPVQNYYINAQLNVLQWHIMGQNVDL